MALSGSRDGAVILWDIATGQEIRRFGSPTVPVRAVLFSPDGRQAVSGGGNVQVSESRPLDNSVVLWDVATGQEIRRFDGHTAPIRALAFSPDGQRILSGSDDNTMLMWDVQSGQLLRTFGMDDPATTNIEGHLNAILSVAFSPDGTQILSGSRDRRVLLWNAATGQVVQPLLGHESEVNSVVFSPDGRQALSAAGDLTETGDNANALYLWDLDQGEVIRHFRGHSGPVRVVAFSPDGRGALSASGDGLMIVWRVDTLDQVINWAYSRYQVLCLDATAGFNKRLGPNPRCETVVEEQNVVRSVPEQQAPATNTPICTLAATDSLYEQYQLPTGSADTAPFRRTGPYTIGYSSANAADPHSAYLAAWARYEADQQGITLSVTDAGGDFNKQVADIQAFISQGVSAIIVDPLEDVTIVPLLDALHQARAANIAVVVVNHPLVTGADAGNDYVSFVGANDFDFGCIMAQELVAVMDGQGNLMHLNGRDGTPSDNARKDGAIEVFNLYPEFVFVDEFATEFNPETARSGIEADLNKGQVVDGLWSYNGFLSLVGEQTLAANGRSLVPVVGDNDVQLAGLMVDNHLRGALARVPSTMGADAVKTTLAILAGQPVSRWVSIPIQVMSSESLTGINLEAESGLIGEADGLPEAYRPKF
jgi:ABC-type sugar transport system substrate-binding protein